MSTVAEIENAVLQLSADERAAFRAWFAAYDADDWDRQMDEDSSSGRLDWLAEEARADSNAGRCSPL